MLLVTVNYTALVFKCEAGDDAKLTNTMHMQCAENMTFPFIASFCVLVQLSFHHEEL